MYVRRVFTVVMYLMLWSQVVRMRELVKVLGSKGQYDVWKKKQQQEVS
jgi:hypothetical protein